MDGDNEPILRRMDDAFVRSCAALRELFRYIAEAARLEAWWEEGARDLPHLLGMRYGISSWKAHRWVQAAVALESLPVIADAFASGVLGVDKVVELTRFATPETEEGLVRWARSVPSGRIREEGDLRARREREQTADADRLRRVDWGFEDEGRRFSMVADLPAADGAVVAGAIERIAATLPTTPDEPADASQRRADALVALASGEAGAGHGGNLGAGQGDPPSATIVIHARADSVATGEGALIEGGGVAGPSSVQRLLCDARVQVVVENARGDALGFDRLSREPSEAMLRQLRYRDRTCTFPGCERRAGLRAHHIAWWSAGGKTTLQNLTLVCGFHHKLAHEYGWSMTRGLSGAVRWYRPDGRRYRAGPAPPNASARHARASTTPQFAVA